MPREKHNLCTVGFIGQAHHTVLTDQRPKTQTDDQKVLNLLIQTIVADNDPSTQLSPYQTPDKIHHQKEQKQEKG